MRYMLHIFNIFGAAYKLSNWKLYLELSEGNTTVLRWSWAANKKRAPPAENTGTLMQDSKFISSFKFIWKQYPENFTFLILRILELFTHKIYTFSQ